MTSIERLELELPGSELRSSLIVGPGLLAQAGDLKNIREIIDKARVRAAQEEKDRAEGRGSAGDAPGRSSRRRSLKGSLEKSRRSRRSSGSIDEAAA